MSNTSPVINGENTGSVDFRELLTAPGTTASGVNAAAARAAYNMVAAMSEHLSTNVRQNEFQTAAEDSKAGILSFPCDFDHMYASMTDGGAPATSALGVSPLRGNEARHHDLTEVKHLKELLLLHLDLIQQQSEQIVTKDKLLAALRQENETLKLRLERMDRRVNLQKLRSDVTENSVLPDHAGACSPTSLNSPNTASTSDHQRNTESENSSPPYNESFKIRLNTSGGITTVKQEPSENHVKNESKHETFRQESSSDSRHDWEIKKKRKSESSTTSIGKRKRGVSCSSTVSNDTTSTIPDNKSVTHENVKKTDKKGKSITKKESFLTTEEHYFTSIGEPNYTLSLSEPVPSDNSASLEVPNWRVKVYTSCYTMEGTENLDDEIFNKRHLKLENDERRRKRWDFQRIREQRHIEKLKQRQERQNHQATCYNTNHTGPCPTQPAEEAVSTLWPEPEQIQGLQVDSRLPVTAFGVPIPTFTPTEFSLPWLHTARSKNRRTKRSTGRRKSSRR
ncbi:male-specific lethal 1 homolog [Neodiprion fabricii]|uniref:male-specific lethal 1 homolog n=1 Tax=Neodiprion fabricii TaxID=2872261 RepID=UPI001ED8CF95|nr:male-specific lethal 1 homolog [Neodiprion fabricii]